MYDAQQTYSPGRTDKNNAETYRYLEIISCYPSLQERRGHIRGPREVIHPRHPLYYTCVRIAENHSPAQRAREKTLPLTAKWVKVHREEKYR